MHRLACLLCLSLFLLLPLFASVAHAATLIVTSNADSGAGTLRAAIASAGNGDTINFSTDMTITLTSGNTLMPVKNIAIDATGHSVAVDGNKATTVFTVDSGVIVQLTGLIIQNGSAPKGGGIWNSGTVMLSNSTLSSNIGIDPYTQGGGIWNSGTMTLTHSILSGNSVSGDANGSYGGGIYNGGTITLFDTTLSGNSAIGKATGGFGGGIFNVGTITLINSTLSGNSAIGGANGFGGGLCNGRNGDGTLTNSTLSGNTATGGIDAGGGIFNESTNALTLTNSTLSSNSASGGVGNSGDGIASGSTVPMTLTNTIIADGCAITIIDNGGNIDAGTSCGFSAATSKSNATLNLGPLANNGGLTQTVLPGAGSMAIDAGVDSVCTAAPVNGADQRGIPRPQGAHCDSGAVEVVMLQTLTVGVVGSGAVSAGTAPAPQNGVISNCASAGGANCSAAYATGQSVILATVVPEGQKVTWGGACAAAGSSMAATVMMSSSQSCTAAFTVTPSAVAAPALSRWTLMVLCGVLGAGVLWRARRSD